MVLVSETRTFDISLNKDIIRELLIDIDSFVKNIPGANIVEKSDNRYIVEVIWKSFLRSTKEVFVITVRQIDENTIYMYIVSENGEMTINIKLVEMFPFTRVEVSFACKSVNEKYCKKAMKYLGDSIGRYLRISARTIQPQLIKKPTITREISETKPLIIRTKPSVEIRKETPIEELEKLFDPIHIASLLLKARYIKRISKKIEEKTELFNEIINNIKPNIKEEYKTLMISIRGPNTEVYTYITREGEIIAFYGFIDNEEIKGTKEDIEKLLSKLHGKQVDIKAWGITEPIK